MPPDTDLSREVGQVSLDGGLGGLGGLGGEAEAQLEAHGLLVSQGQGHLRPGIGVGSFHK